MKYTIPSPGASSCCVSGTRISRVSSPSSPNKPDLIATIEKWENIIPGIVGWPPDDKLSQPVQREVDNGWAVNLTAIVTVSVQNKGSVDTPASNLTIKLQKNRNIIELKTVSVKSLRPNEKDTIGNVKLQFPQENWSFFGDAVIYAKVDSRNLISEINETNNSSTRGILLADPRPDRKLDRIFPNQEAAIAYVQSLGFFEDSYFGLRDVGWAKYLQGAQIRSRRDGKLKDSNRYRQDAVIVKVKLQDPPGQVGFVVAIQGTASFGEP